MKIINISPKLLTNLNKFKHSDNYGNLFALKIHGEEITNFFFDAIDDNEDFSINVETSNFNFSFRSSEEETVKVFMDLLLNEAISSFKKITKEKILYWLKFYSGGKIPLGTLIIDGKRVHNWENKFLM